MDLLAVVMMLVLCRYCSAQEGGCTPPAGSNLTVGHGKLISNGIPQQNRGVPGSEFNIHFGLSFYGFELMQACEVSLEAMD